MNTQRNAIANHLKSGKAITPLDALRDFNCFRLGARIWELKKQGMPIEKIMVTRGKKTFARYYLAA